MTELTKAKTPFRFYNRFHLSELTGLKASNIDQLLELIKQVPGSCIYHHTHRYLEQHQYYSPEPPNDFAYWITNILGDSELGEMLASIDTLQFGTIRSLREKIISSIEEYIKNNPLAKLRFSKQGQEFYFIKSISFIIETNYLVNDLIEFNEAIKKITVSSLYFHIFESRLRLEKKTNDFSNWIENSLYDKELADKIAHLDPYTHTMENLRKTIINIIEQRIH